jgi:hypothetical protein
MVSVFRDNITKPLIVADYSFLVKRLMRSTLVTPGISFATAGSVMV